MLTPANIANLIAEPYNWAEWAAEHHMYDTPDNTWIHGAYDITVNPPTTSRAGHGDDYWMRLGMLQRIYGDTTLHAQEN
jgi:hypothetical protein